MSQEPNLFSDGPDQETPGPGFAGSSATSSGRALDPLAVRMRPRSLDEVVGQEHLTFPGSPLNQLVEASGGDRAGASSVILWGPPGVGKTTLAHVISHAPGRTFVELSAITAGVKDVRQVIESARREREMYGRTTVLFLDEIHRFSKAQQDALLPAVENRLVVLVAATTENPSFSVISPLLSRSLMLTLRPLDDEAVGNLLDRAVESDRGLAGQFTLTEEARNFIVRIAGADARRSLTILEAAAGIAAAQTEEAKDEPIAITESACAEASSETVLRYDKNGDQHYDVVSAFIKSIRGSDVDAALHFLARMIVAGEDPRFIARRVIISAAEDIGMADPQALPIAVAASTAVANIGMPEGRIPLDEAVTYLALAPKSNASYRALDAAIADVKNGLAGQVPMHLRDAHYPGAKELGHGEGYKYSHDYPHGVADQEYLPETLRGKRYYSPTGNGMERSMAERLENLRRLLRP